MSVINFPKLLTLEIAHSYYDGRCQDFSFVMDEATKRLAGRGRLLIRERDGMLLVLYEAAADDTPIASIAGETLHIGLKLRNKAFANFTQLPAGVPPRNLAYTNTQDARTLDVPSQFAFASDLFTHTIASAVRPIDVAVVDASGAVFKVETVAAGESSTSFDLRAMRRGPFTVEERGAGPVTSTQFYLDAEMRGDDVFAIAHFTIAQNFYTDPPAFKISFSARVDRLMFYVVAQNHTAADLLSLTVEDAGLANADSPVANAPPAVAFDQLDAATINNDEIAMALKSAKDLPLAVFRSKVDVPRRQRAARRLRLMRLDKELIANLRQPGADQPDAALIIHVSKP